MPFDIPPALREQVIAFVRKVPAGKVVGYGQVAAGVGIEDARVIGWIMHGTGAIPDFPWWRVLSNTGKLTIKDPVARGRQAELLAAEGIIIEDDQVVAMEAHRYGTVQPPAKRQQRLL